LASLSPFGNCKIVALVCRAANWRRALLHRHASPLFDEFGHIVHRQRRMHSKHECDVRCQCQGNRCKRRLRVERSLLQVPFDPLRPGTLCRISNGQGSVSEYRSRSQLAEGIAHEIKSNRRLCWAIPRGVIAHHPTDRCRAVPTPWRLDSQRGRPSTVARPTLDSEVGAPDITVQRSNAEGAPRGDTSWASATSCTRWGVPSCAPTASMGSGRIDLLFRRVVAGHALLNRD
jgi:hypothetical protein